jgi:hypothetical protein
MVSFTELVELVKKNPTQKESLPSWKVVEPTREWRSTRILTIEPPPPPVKQISVKRDAGAPPPVITPVPTLPTCRISPYGRPIDPICIGIADILYEGASLLVARQMEKEEAIRVEAAISSIYSAEGGRSRGWTKKLLNAHCSIRAAVGGDLFELQKGKLGFDWSSLFTSKETSALFDFFCVAKRIRCIVWKDSLHFGLWPAADPAVLTKEPSLFHITINEVGEARYSRGPDKIQKVFEWVDATPTVGWTPALSCLSILSTKTVADLEKDAAEIGISILGKKSEQIVQIAAARRRRSIFNCSSK